jgi:hypothetical protein
MSAADVRETLLGGRSRLASSARSSLARVSPDHCQRYCRRSVTGHRSLSAGQIILSAIIALAEQTKKIANSRDQRTTPRIQQMRSCVFDKFCSFHD